MATYGISISDSGIKLANSVSTGAVSGTLYTVPALAYAHLVFARIEGSQTTNAGIVNNIQLKSADGDVISTFVTYTSPGGASVISSNIELPNYTSATAFRWPIILTAGQTVTYVGGSLTGGGQARNVDWYVEIVEFS